MTKFQMIVDVPGQSTTTMMCADYDHLLECLALVWMYSEQTGLLCHIEVEELILDDQSLN